MNLRKLGFVLVCLLPLTAAAQFTQVSGTIVDPNGIPYANGTIVPLLNISGSPVFTGSNSPYTPPTQPVGLSLAGSFIMQLADNTQLTPAGSTWTFTVCSGAGSVPPALGKGPVCFSVGPLTISGASQSLTTSLTAAALALTVVLSGAAGTGTFAASPNAVTVDGIPTLYPGAGGPNGGALCNALAAAISANSPGANFRASGFTGIQVCTGASLTSLITAMQGLGGQAHVYLGGPLVWYLPQQASIAATASSPLGGTLSAVPLIVFEGVGSGVNSNSVQTEIAICQGLNDPVAGCAAPQTHQFLVSSTSITTASNRTYMAINSAGMDLVAGEPVHLNGGGVGAANLAITGAYRICHTNTTDGVTGVLADPVCPANPTSATVWVPVSSGVTSATIVSGGTGGNYDANTIVTFTGGGCVNEPTGFVTTNGTIITAFNIITRGRGCTSAPSVVVTDPGGTGSGANLTATVAGGTMVCAASCNSTLHGSIPMLETTDYSDNNSIATFGTQFLHMTVDCREVMDCVGYRTMGANEHTKVEDINFAGQIERAIDVHLKSTNGMDVIKSVRVVPGNQPNNPVPNTASGTVNTAGTAVTSVSGTQFQSTAGVGYTWHAGTPILINGVYFQVQSVTDATHLVLTTSAGTQTGVPYIVGGCDAGTEGVFIADGGPHGIQDMTMDYSGCPTSGSLPFAGPTTTTQQVPNWGIRLDAYDWGLYLLGGHSEKVWAGIVAGPDAPARGWSVNNWWGAPNNYINLVGQYQNAQPPVVRIFNDFWSNSNGTTGTTDYDLSNIVLSSGSFYTIVDDNPVGLALTPGPAAIDRVTSHYSVDSSVLQGSGTTLCQTVRFTGYFGDNDGCPFNGYLHSASTQTLKADIASVGVSPGTTAFTFSGFTQNTTYGIECYGTTVQSTAGGGIGILFQTAGTATPTEIHAIVATSATATAFQSSGTVSNTTANIIYAGSTGTITTALPFRVEGSIQVGATPPGSLNIAFYTIVGGDAVALKANSTCSIH